MRCGDMSSKTKTRLGSPLVALTLVAFSVCGAGPARADYALLTNGLRLHVERQEQQGSVVRLFIPGGYVDVASSEVQGYEKEEAAPSPELPAKAAEAAAPLKSILQGAGRRQGLDPDLLKSMIAEESNFNARAVSSKGARGLMQLMPGTGQLLGVRDFFSADENVQGGALYIRALLERYAGDLAKALAAYNAGPAAVDRYRGIPPFTETQNYVRRVITRFNREKMKK